MINTDIKAAYEWSCTEYGCRAYFKDTDKERLDQTVTAHKARHKIEREQRENQEREGTD